MLLAQTAIKASTDAKALAAKAKSQRERRNQFPLGQIWDVWKTCNYLSQKQNEGSASGMETLGRAQSKSAVLLAWSSLAIRRSLIGVEARIHVAWPPETKDRSLGGTAEH